MRATRLSKLLLKALRTDSNSVASVPLNLTKLVGQTANAIEFRDTDDTTLLFGVDASGVVTSAGGVTNPADNSVALAKLVRGTNGQLAIGQTGAATAYKTVSGEATLDANGVLTLAEGLVHCASVALTNAQIKNLRATPVELVAAPAAGKMLEFISAKLLLVAGANALTEAGYNLAVKFTGSAGVQVSQTIECTGFIDQAVNTITNAQPKIDAIVAASAASAANLVLHNLGGGEFAGNAALDATMKIDVCYRVRATT